MRTAPKLSTLYLPTCSANLLLGAVSPRPETQSRWTETNAIRAWSTILAKQAKLPGEAHRLFVGRWADRPALSACCSQPLCFSNSLIFQNLSRTSEIAVPLFYECGRIRSASPLQLAAWASINALSCSANTALQQGCMRPW